MDGTADLCVLCAYVSQNYLLYYFWNIVKVFGLIEKSRNHIIKNYRSTLDFEKLNGRKCGIFPCATSSQIWYLTIPGCAMRINQRHWVSFDERILAAFEQAKARKQHETITFQDSKLAILILFSEQEIIIFRLDQLQCICLQHKLSWPRVLFSFQMVNCIQNVVSHKYHMELEDGSCQ